MAEVYLVSLINDNWDDFMQAFRTRVEAVDYITECFEPDYYREEGEEPPADDSEAYWDSISEAYERGGWKSFQFLVLDTETLVLTDAALAPKQEAE